MPLRRRRTATGFGEPGIPVGARHTSRQSDRGKGRPARPCPPPRNPRWHDMIGVPTLADAILDRLVHNAYRIELSGESLRKPQAS